jgi:hypothetical protein
MAKFDYQKDIIEADQSLLDLMEKYPEVTTGVPDYLQNKLRKLKFRQRQEGKLPPDHPSFEWSEDVDMWGKKPRQIKPMPELEKRFKQAIETDDPKFQRFNISGRGGTKEMQEEMKKIDLGTRKPETDYKDPDEYLGGMYPDIVEEKKLTLKDRLRDWWADADKREAFLGGITDSMTEVKFGQDAYQSRFHDTQKKIRQNLKVAEMTKLARQKAQLDMLKVAAETSKFANPAQYMTTSQKDAMAIVTASGLRPGSPEWNQEYSRQLQQIVVKDLTSAKASAIQPLYTFAQVLLNSQDAQEKLTGEAMMRAIESIAGYLAGTDVGGGKSRNVIEVTDTETTTKTIP